jgi:cathepsin L
MFLNKKKMKLFSLFTLLATVVSAETLQSRENYEKVFYNWMKDYNINFDNGNEFYNRLNIFIANDEYINDINSQNLPYKLAHNQFSHLTPCEFSSYNNLQPNTKKVSNHFDYTRQSRSLKSNTDDFDWTTKGAVTPVKDQAQCGSCWAFSTTGSLEGAYFLKNGNLESFSEQNLVDCDTNDLGCNGGLMDNAFSWIKKNGGLELETDYKYTATTNRCSQDSSKLVNGSAPVSWVDVKQTNDDLISAIEKQPVSVAIEADQSTFQFYSSGVLTGRCGTNLDHGVLAVGYGTLDGVDYYKLKNSWGTSWGMDGYVLIERKDVKGGQCGILMSASYPVL